MMLWSIEPKIDWNRLLQTIESKNLVAIIIVSNSVNMHTKGIGKKLILKLAKFHLLFFSPSLLSGGGLGPLHVEDEVVVAEPVEGGDRLGRVLLPVVVDEGEPLALAGHLVLGEEDARDVAEGPEELKGGFFKHEQEVSAKRRDIKR